MMEFYGGLTYSDFWALTIGDHRALLSHARKRTKELNDALKPKKRGR